MSEKIPVLVTGVGGGGHGHEIVKALKLAGRYRLIGVDMASSSFGLFDVDEAYTIPAASDPSYINIVLDICDKHQVKVVFHGSEPDLKALSENRDRLIGVGIIPMINTKEVIRIGMNKKLTMSFLHEKGFTLPIWKEVKEESEIPNDFPLPAVIKPSVGGGGSKNLFLAQDQEELAFACRYTIKYGFIAFLQEYVGTPEDEYTVGVLHTLDGKLIGSIAVRRYILSGLSGLVRVANRTGRKELSPILALSSGISQGEIDDFPQVRRTCENIAEAIGSKGPINIQCRFVNDELYPFEINPRFSGTTYMRALVGFNEPDLMISHHLLKEVLPEKISYKYGRLVRGLSERYVSELPAVNPWR